RDNKLAERESGGLNFCIALWRNYVSRKLTFSRGVPRKSRGGEQGRGLMLEAHGFYKAGGF
ncbi:MAG: hypothetical protein ACKO81_10915, partial [Planctomycetota bacterium]